VLLHWIRHSSTYLPVTFSNDFFVHYTTSSTKSDKCQFIAKNGELQDGEVATLYNVTEENLRKEERAKLIASMNIALQGTQMLANGENRNAHRGGIEYNALSKLSC